MLELVIAERRMKMKNQLMSLHRQLIKKGNFKAAKRIRVFLEIGILRLNTTDTDFLIEGYLDDLGFKSRITHHGNCKWYFLA